MRSRILKLSFYHLQYGVVCEGYDSESKQKVAIKIFKDFDRTKILAEANAELNNEMCVNNDVISMECLASADS